MAKRTIVKEVLTDDLDGSAADRTITFGYDGVQYEIELSRRNASALEKVMAPYVGAGRKVRGVNGSKRRGSNGGADKQNRAAYLGQVREWAARNGYAVAERGRVPAAVVDAYEAAMT